jgi:type IV pilus assembly protein PilV
MERFLLWRITKKGGEAMPKKRSAAHSGFTLIELLVAIVVLSVGLLAIAGMQVTAIRGNASANVISTKTAVAEGILEEILSWSIQDPRLSSNSTNVTWDFDPDTAGVQDTLTLTGAGFFTATYSITPDFGADYLTRVEVVVRSLGRSNVLTTLVGFKRTI